MNGQLNSSLDSSDCNDYMSFAHNGTSATEFSLDSKGHVNLMLKLSEGKPISGYWSQNNLYLIDKIMFKYFLFTLKVLQYFKIFWFNFMLLGKI